MAKDKRACISCKKITNCTVCELCVCSIPDCESVALQHAKCFYHWFKESKMNNLKLCDETCWQCKQTSNQNHTEFVYILNSIKKHNEETMAFHSVVARSMSVQIYTLVLYQNILLIYQ